MYIIRVGYYVWVHANGLLTTSLNHAQPFATEAEAEVAARWVRDNYVQAVGGLPERPRTLRAYYLEKRPPVEVRLRAEEHAELCGVEAKGEAAAAATPVAGTPHAAPAPRAQPATSGEPKPPGITRQVYQWCLDHPQASKADALAAWPAANPSTVGVQYSAARRAAQ